MPKSLDIQRKTLQSLRLQGFFFGAEGEIRTLKSSLKPIENTRLFIFVANVVAKSRKERFHLLHRLGHVGLRNVRVYLPHSSVVRPSA